MILLTHWKCLSSGGVSQLNRISGILDKGGCAMKAKIILMIVTVLASIATIVSAIFAVLSYFKM